MKEWEESLLMPDAQQAASLAYALWEEPSIFWNSLLMIAENSGAEAGDIHSETVKILLRTAKKKKETCIYAEGYLDEAGTSRISVTVCGKEVVLQLRNLKTVERSRSTGYARRVQKGTATAADLKQIKDRLLEAAKQF